MNAQQQHSPTDNELRAAEAHDTAYLQYFSDVCERRDRAMSNPVSTFEAVGGEFEQGEPAVLPASPPARGDSNVVGSARGPVHRRR